MSKIEILKSRKNKEAIAIDNFCYMYKRLNTKSFYVFYAALRYGFK